MHPVIVPASGCSLLFTGFSAIGFAFAAVASGAADDSTMNPNSTSANSTSAADTLRSSTEDNAVTYYVFNGIGIFMALMAALPLQCSVTKHRLRNTAICGSLATTAFTVGVVFGVMENYKVYELASTPAGGELYFFSWISAVCSSIANGVLTVLAIMALLYPYTGVDEIMSPPPDVEMPPKRKLPKSRADLGK